MKNWNKIGRVSRKGQNGQIEYFDSLVAAVLYLKKEDLKKVNNQCYNGCSVLYTLSDGRKRYHYYGDEYIIRDELDLIIPQWKIIEAWESVARNRWGYPRGPATVRGRYRPVRDHWEFRNGPVPYIRSHRRWYSGGGRPRIQQEVRENEFLSYDDDAIDHGIKYRCNRDQHIDPWDEYYDRNPMDRSWKRYRKTQWKEKSDA